MGHSIPGDDIFYPLGMLAARFLVIGVAFIYIARDPVRHAVWIAALLYLWRPRVESSSRS